MSTLFPAPAPRSRRLEAPSRERSRRPSPWGMTWSVVGFGLIVVAASCGPDEPDGEGPSGPSNEAEAFAGSVTAAFCDGLDACCAARSNAFDRSACESGVSGLLAQLAPDPEALRFDAAAAEQCLASVRAALPSCAGIDLEPCNRVYVGTVATGEPCDRDAQCAPVEGSRVYCQQVCKAARRAAEGEACARTCRSETDCGTLPGEPPSNVVNEVSWGECFTEDGLGCVGGACVRGPRDGACLGGAVCDRGFECRDGTCTALAAIGQPCTSSRCVDGSYCSASEVCEAEIANGERCLEEEGCASGNCALDSCGTDSCPPTCRPSTLGSAHGSAAECGGTVHL